LTRRFIELEKRQYEIFGNCRGYGANLVRIAEIEQELAGLE